MGNKRTRLLFLIVTISLILSNILFAFAFGYGEHLDDTATNGNIQHRVVFLIDVSGSMNSEDPDNIRAEITKMLIDSMPSSITEVGFAAFTTEIVNSHPLTPIAAQADRDFIKTQIDQLITRGGTDIGIGLNYAVHMLVEAQEQESSQAAPANIRSSIIFISDGERTNAVASDRTMADADADQQEATELAVQHNISIHSISTNAAGSFDITSMRDISDATGGNWHTINQMYQLPEIFEVLLAELAGISLVRQDIVATGIPQVMSFTVPHLALSSETNIIAWHNNSLNEGFAVEGADLYQSRRFDSIKLEDGAEGAEITFAVSEGASVTFFVINHFEIIASITMPENLSARYIPVTVGLYRFNSASQLSEQDLIPLTGEHYYAGLSAQIIATDSFGYTTVIPMENTGSGFEAVYRNLLPGVVHLRVDISSTSLIAGDFLGAEALSGFVATTTIPPIIFANTPPIAIPPTMPSEFRRQNSVFVIDLNQIFYDADGDVLSFEVLREYYNLEGAFEGLGRVELNNYTLTVDLSTRGSESFLIQVNDGRGGMLAYQVAFEIVPWWIYFRVAIFIIALIFVILLIAYLLFTKRMRKSPVAASLSSPVLLAPSKHKFSDSCFEGYFLNTLSGRDVPILNWSASYIRGKHKITLSEMFDMLDVDEKLPEARKIFFEAGNNNSVIFYHSTDSVISFDNRDIPKGKKEVLSYDSKLYIVFEDHSTEIEIRYKRVKKNTVASSHLAGN